MPDAVEQLPEVPSPLAGYPKLVHAAKVLSTPQFLNQAQLILNHPNRQALLYVEVGWVIALILFRTWLNSRISHWLVRIGVRMLLNLLGWVMSSLIIPYLLLGDAYPNLLYSLYQGWTQS